MTPYEHLEQLAAAEGIPINTHILRKDDVDDGYFIALKDGRCIILINAWRPLSVRTAALAEELGHFYKSIGDLRDLSSIIAAKSENLGKAWGYEHLLPEPVLQEALHEDVSLWDVADETNLPADYIMEAVSYHQQKPKRKIKKLPREVLQLVQKKQQKQADKAKVQQDTLNRKKPLPPPQQQDLPPEEPSEYYIYYVESQPFLLSPAELEALTMPPITLQQVKIRGFFLFNWHADDSIWDNVLDDYDQYRGVFPKSFYAEPLSAKAKKRLDMLYFKQSVLEELLVK